MTRVFISASQTSRMRELANACANYLSTRGLIVLLHVTDEDSELWGIQRLSLIRHADAILVFFDYPSPWMGVELGYAMGAQKEVIIVADSGTAIPSLLADVQLLRVTPDREDIFARIEKSILQSASQNKPQEWRTDNLHEFARICRADPDILEQISYEKFEAFVGDAFSALGYEPVRPPEGVQVDFLLNNFEGPRRVAVEVKKWGRSRKVPVGMIQQFVGSLFGQEVDAGLFLSTAEFTESAKDFARLTGDKVRLWTFEDLAMRLAGKEIVVAQSTSRKTKA